MLSTSSLTFDGHDPDRHRRSVAGRTPFRARARRGASGRAGDERARGAATPTESGVPEALRPSTASPATPSRPSSQFPTPRAELRRTGRPFRWVRDAESRRQGALPSHRADLRRRRQGHQRRRPTSTPASSSTASAPSCSASSHCSELLRAFGFDLDKLPKFVTQTLDVASDARSRTPSGCATPPQPGTRSAGALGPVATATSDRTSTRCSPISVGSRPIRRRDATEPRRRPERHQPATSILLDAGRDAPGPRSPSRSCQAERATRRHGAASGTSWRTPLPSPPQSTRCSQFAQGLKLPEVVTARLDWSSRPRAWPEPTIRRRGDLPPLGPGHRRAHARGRGPGADAAGKEPSALVIVLADAVRPSADRAGEVPDPALRDDRVLDRARQEARRQRPVPRAERHRVRRAALVRQRAEGHHPVRRLQRPAVPRRRPPRASRRVSTSRSPTSRSACSR